MPGEKKEKILHKGKSITGPKKPQFGKETPMMPCRTSAPFLLSSGSFERIVGWLGYAGLKRISCDNHLVSRALDEPVLKGRKYMRSKYGRAM